MGRVGRTDDVVYRPLQRERARGERVCRRDWIPGRERGEKFESSRGMDEWMGFPEIALPALFISRASSACYVVAAFSCDQ